jgi:hypothetical protein
VDEVRAGAAGIRKLTGKHLVLYTDVPSSPHVDNLPAVFDKAVPQWAEYFSVPESKTRNWQAQGFFIRPANRPRFEALSLMPEGNNQFQYGISIGREFWFYSQPDQSEYYDRHLMLHEGTHAFMASLLGGCGPGWYMEGTAELMGTHRLDDRYQQLTLRTMPASRDEVPMWGRIKLIEDALAANRALSLPAVLEINNRERLGNEAYAWCWAAAKFLDAHPRYQARFRKLRNQVVAPDFNDLFRRRFRGDWSNLQAEWQAFVKSLEYGYDFERMAIDFRGGTPLNGVAVVKIAADRGWQSSGARLEAGKSYRITAQGRFQIAHDDQPWPCEPGGVTIEYHDGRPLGMLVGAIDGRATGATLADSFPIGQSTMIKPTADGTLYLRVNDSAARLDDNRGTLNVTISPSD